MTGTEAHRGAGYPVQVSKLPAGPYEYITTARFGEHHGIGHVYLIDRTGRKIATLWGKADEKLALVNFIIDAKAKEDTDHD